MSAGPAGCQLVGMGTRTWAGPWALTWAVVLPVATAAVLGLLRAVVVNTSASLILVLVVTAVAVRAERAAGLLAAVIAALAFDFFLAPPFYELTIFERADLETTLLLLAVGAAVTELAQWGRRERARASRREGYVAGVAGVARMAVDGATSDLVTTVGAMIAEVLDLDRCEFRPGPPRPDRPRLHPDGCVTWNRRPVDVGREGLPTMDRIELATGRGDGVYELTASTRVRRPDLERRLVAATLAEQVDTRPTASAHMSGSGVQDRGSGSGPS